MDNKIVFLYPGQGSQHIGMGLDLYQTYPEAREIFDHADRFLGFSLSRLCFEGPEEALNSDLNAQLAVYTVSCALTNILMTQDILPCVVSGYSSGFYSAAYVAGCFDFAGGLHIVRRAGEILLDEGQKTKGSMAVIFGLSLEEVKHFCRQAGNVEVAILNTPRQIVISGISSSVTKAMEISLNEGALDAYKLSVATAYHSKFMENSSTRFLREFEDTHVNDPQIPLISYLSLDALPTGEELKKMMAAQLSHPVLWVDLVKRLGNRNNRLFVEIGPGTTLFRTVRWIDRNIDISITANEVKLEEVIERCKSL